MNEILDHVILMYFGFHFIQILKNIVQKCPNIFRIQVVKCLSLKCLLCVFYCE